MIISANWSQPMKAREIIHRSTIHAAGRWSLAIFAATLAVGVGAAMAQGSGVEVGVLNCNVQGGASFVIGSSKQLDCVFESGNRRERYSGVINKFGVDIGVTGEGIIGWAVFAPTSDPEPGALQGTYSGVSGEASMGFGLGANALIGGSKRTIGLQPLSLQAQSGVNFAIGVAAIELRAY
jgi:hypothetical protein